MVVATRPLRGSRLASFFPSVPAEGPSLSDLDSAFQLQEYIALLIRKNPHDVDTIVSLPERVKMSGKEDDKSDMSQDKGDVVVDEACWIYEQLRRLAQDLTHPLITLLQQECSRASCPEMKAGEWLYLCVAHGNDGAMEQCCAIDYIIHTLDSATALLNSPRAFPSRISIPQPSVRHFSSLARRLGRIFAHAYFHHREAFESAEAENSLYARFLALTSRFELVPPEFLVIPPRMTNTDASSTSPAEAEPPRLLGAALNPQPPSPERSGLAGYESPRKVGRNRTDTMVFSEAEAYSEALRGNTGSPPDPGSSDTSEHRVHQGLNLDTAESETETAEGIPPVDKLEILANSEEACLSAPAVAEKSKPYTLTFSASGTMKAALPPGVSPSSSSTSGIGLMPSFVSPNQGASQIGTQEYRDSIEERVPTADGDEESALDTVLAQEEDEDGNSDRSVIDLLARKQVLEGKVQGMGANDDEDDIAEWASRIHATRPIERVGAAAGGGIGEVPARREVDSDASQEEVAVGGRENELHEEAETGSEVHEKESSPIQPHEELPSSATEEPDTGRKMDHTVEVASDENNASTTEAKNTAEDDSSSTASSSEEVASAETPSESESQGEATAETQSDGKLKTESDGPNTSLEAGLADVEKALKE